MDAKFTAQLVSGEWETLEIADVDSLHVVGSPKDGFSYTIIGKRSDEPNAVETGIIDIKERFDPLFASPLPRTDDGDSIAVMQRENAA